MANMNPRNFGSCTGRLTRNLSIFTNSDGSRKVLFTVAARDNFSSGPNHEMMSQFIPLEAFVPKNANSLGVYAHMHKGDLVQVTYSVRTSTFTNKANQTEYRTSLVVTDVALLESKATADARRGGETADNTNANPAQPAPQTPAQAMPEADAGVNMDAPFGV